jgi:signal peptidase II
VTIKVAVLREKAAGWFAEARANPLFLFGLAGAGAVAALDQATKYWVVRVLDLPSQLKACDLKPGEFCRQISLSPIFDLTYVENRGASFGMLAGGMASRILLSSISIAIATVMVVWLGRLNRRFAAAGAGLIIGGAIGNLYDRVRYGYVVDFLDFSGLMFPWVFNVADAAINVGFACLIIDALLHKDGKAAK